MYIFKINLKLYITLILNGGGLVYSSPISIPIKSTIERCKLSYFSAFIIQSN